MGGEDWAGGEDGVGALAVVLSWEAWLGGSSGLDFSWGRGFRGAAMGLGGKGRAATWGACDPRMAVLMLLPEGTVGDCRGSFDDFWGLMRR
jgi:hypothetical protein